MGEVGREAEEKRLEKKADVYTKGWDGVYASQVADEEGGQERDKNVIVPPTDMGRLRQEAQEWGRMIYPPLHHKAHVTMDLCSSDGT